MVSFFGLKIGGEKKKKPTNGVQISAPQPQHVDRSDALDSDFFDFGDGPKLSYEASVHSLSRQESGQSNMSKMSKLRGLKLPPFVSTKFSSSQVDLHAPPSLRHHASNPSLGRKWKADSATNLGLMPPGIKSLARPRTSHSKSKNWVEPLDVPHREDTSRSVPRAPLKMSLNTQTEGSISTSSSAVPKSPLGQYELKLDLPSDVSTFADLEAFSEMVQAPPPLRIKKQPSTQSLAERQIKGPLLQKPPSPPQSIDYRETTDSPMTELPKNPTAESRLPSDDNHYDIPSGLERELQNAISNFGPTSPPSPCTTPRASEEELPSTTAIPPRSASPFAQGANPQPIIQNVKAKRDTLTINPHRRRSLQMNIEAAGGGKLSLQNIGRPFDRPPQLNLNTAIRMSTADRNGPRSAPFLPSSARTLTPTNSSPLRSQVEIQAQNKPSPLGSQDLISRLDSPTGSSIYGNDDDDSDNDDDEFERPSSPESPLIPLTGPLASPLSPPSSHSSSRHYGAFPFPSYSEEKGKRSLSPIAPTLAPPIPPRSTRRNLPTPDSARCPPPTPIRTTFDRAARSPSPADSRMRSGSESESLFSAYEPFVPPRISVARSGADSPTIRSFSRPWTPTKTSNDITGASLKRAEPARPLASSGDDVQGGLRPPPRSATVKTPRTEMNNLGSGFI